MCIVTWNAFDDFKIYLEGFLMAQTAKGNKRTYVHGYTKSNGTKVDNHYRSNSNACKGKKK